MQGDKIKNGQKNKTKQNKTNKKQSPGLWLLSVVLWTLGSKNAKRNKDETH